MLKKILNDEKIRSTLFQGVGLLFICSIIYYFFVNTQANLTKQNIQTGFGFFELEAGFDISESMIEYWSDDTYLKALYAGILNTAKVALIGNIFAIGLGVIIGVGSLSTNWIIKKISTTYVEIVRNIPLLLQLFFWYAILTENLPDVKDAIEFLPHFFLTNRGLFIPFPVESIKYAYIFVALVVSVLGYFFLERRRDIKTEETGLESPVWQRLNYLIYLLPVVTWMVLGKPTELSMPELVGFNFQGGYTFTPEFTALLVGLIIYTAAFNAEIARAGINSISRGQWEAASSLGLSKKDTMGKIILPQALRVMVPPLTSQILNLTKNSSLAVAIGYPDFVSVTNTTMNQTGQAIECVFLIMVVYLSFSLLTSFIMNIFNNRFNKFERS
ncbi:amino acid ABC transporter permease [Bacteriovorax sp. Seq25_V]|uniref:amino acid ABC transporter permease n=1 Tax=Bacteriovorax sp. Seq25_V TaxID=1201288 RepID=UPI00038A07E2|nr:ABC transporter permease subunit [Bacteriovorax sp. Seq25_V]EQC43948.1 putative amino acid ABC transporter, permease protein [Bacteriovorax sp. Seq25_V]